MQPSGPKLSLCISSLYLGLLLASLFELPHVIASRVESSSQVDLFIELFDSAWRPHNGPHTALNQSKGNLKRTNKQRQQLENSLGQHDMNVTEKEKRER
jgi:hypothetical protein